MPALLTSTSTQPTSSYTASTRPSTSSHRPTWAAWAKARRPVDRRTSSASAAQASCLRLVMTTSAPARANAETISRPRPRLPPVTSATLPFSDGQSRSFIMRNSLTHGRPLVFAGTRAGPDGGGDEGGRSGGRGALHLAVGPAGAHGVVVPAVRHDHVPGAGSCPRCTAVDMQERLLDGSGRCGRSRSRGSGPSRPTPDRRSSRRSAWAVQPPPPRPLRGGAPPGGPPAGGGGGDAAGPPLLSFPVRGGGGGGPFAFPPPPRAGRAGGGGRACRSSSASACTRSGATTACPGRHQAVHAARRPWPTPGIGWPTCSSPSAAATTAATPTRWSPSSASPAPVRQRVERLRHRWQRADDGRSHDPLRRRRPRDGDRLRQAPAGRVQRRSRDDGHRAVVRRDRADAHHPVLRDEDPALHARARHHPVDAGRGRRQGLPQRAAEPQRVAAHAAVRGRDRRRRRWSATR